MTRQSMERGMRAVRRTRSTICQKHRLPAGNCGCVECGKALVAQYAPEVLTRTTR